MTNFKYLFRLSIALMLSGFNILSSNAQFNEGFIYAKITTFQGKVYEGPVRWGGEEVFWFDIFNSSKISNPHIKNMSWKDMERLERIKNNRKINIMGFEIDLDDYTDNADHTHLFTSRFGDLKSVQIIGDERVKVEMKNGSKVTVEGGSNDIGATISIYDNAIGLIKLKWDRIEMIEFLPTPNKLTGKFGEPLYGTVETSNGNFTGFVQWDDDERLDIDKLDGESKDGEVSIMFSNIKSIKKSSDGSRVYLVSGEEVFLTGSNDVDDDNRGIIVVMAGIGRVNIPWGEFDKVTFDNAFKGSGDTYEKYGETNILKGIVTNRAGEGYKGAIAFDLDEIYDAETLEGLEEGIEYIIPFRNIKTIKPQNMEYTRIELKNGKNLLLGNEQDVSDQNDGIFLYMKNDEKKYIPWKDIEKVELY